MTSIIEAVGIERAYGESGHDVRALCGVDLSVAEGESIAILGASGSGKSTLLHILGALDRPTAGSVRVSGSAVDAMSDRARALFRRRQCGFVFQSFFLVPSMTVGENVALSAIVDGERRWRDRAVELLKLLDLEPMLDRLPQELSGGGAATGGGRAGGLRPSSGRVCGRADRKPRLGERQGGARPSPRQPRLSRRRLPRDGDTRSGCRIAGGTRCAALRWPGRRGSTASRCRKGGSH